MHSLFDNSIRINKKLLLLLAAIILNPINFAWSDNDNIDELRKQQRELRDLLDRIGEAQDQRDKKHATLKRLEKQMSCNWGLIQDYDNCEMKHKSNLEAHVSCKQEAKKKAIDCMSSSTE